MSAALAIGQRAWVSARILWGAPITVKFRGVLQALLAALLLVALISWNPADPSLNAASGAAPTNWLGLNGALFADLFMQSLGLAAWPATILLVAFGLAAAIGDAVQQRLKPTALKGLSATGGVLALSTALSALAAPAAWPLAAGAEASNDPLSWPAGPSSALMRPAPATSTSNMAKSLITRA